MDTTSSSSMTFQKEYDHDPIWKGLSLASCIAIGGFAINTLPFLSFISPMTLAILLGAAFRQFFNISTSYQTGINFSIQKLLKVAIMILGLQLSLSQLLEIGWSGLLTIFVILTSTYYFCLRIGKLLKIDSKLTRLIAAGTSICGASAIVATNSVIKAKEEHVAYAISIITLFGFLSMLMFPIIGSFLQLDEATFGFWSGASIHDTAQVIGTAFQGGQQSAEVGIITKLSRVLFLIPIILILSYTTRQETDHSSNSNKKRIAIPWFIVGFLLLVLINTLFAIDPVVKDHINLSNKFIFTIALAAMGLQINFTKLKNTGIRPLLLGASGWVYISSIGLLLVTISN